MLRSIGIPQSRSISRDSGIPFRNAARRRSAVIFRSRFLRHVAAQRFAGTRARWWLFASLCAVSFGLAFGLAIFGAWMVLPYSTAEMGLLYWAWRWFENHARDWECASVVGDRVIVERETGGKRTRRELNRYRTRLEIDDAGSLRAPRLALRFAGESLHFGHALPARERVNVARQLRRALVAR